MRVVGEFEFETSAARSRAKDKLAVVEEYSFVEVEVKPPHVEFEVVGRCISVLRKPPKAGSDADAFGFFVPQNQSYGERTVVGPAAELAVGYARDRRD